MSAGHLFVIGDVIVAVTGFTLSLNAIVVSIQNRNTLIENKRNGAGLFYATSKVWQESLLLAGHLFFLAFAISLVVNIESVVISNVDQAIRAWLVLVFTFLFTAKSAVALYSGKRVRGMTH